MLSPTGGDTLLKDAKRKQHVKSVAGNKHLGVTRRRLNPHVD